MSFWTEPFRLSNPHAKELLEIAKIGYRKKRPLEDFIESIDVSITAVDWDGTVNEVWPDVLETVAMQGKLRAFVQAALADKNLTLLHNRIEALLAECDREAGSEFPEMPSPGDGTKNTKRFQRSQLDALIAAVDQAASAAPDLAVPSARESEDAFVSGAGEAFVAALEADAQTDKQKAAAKLIRICFDRQSRIREPAHAFRDAQLAQMRIAYRASHAEDARSFVVRGLLPTLDHLSLETERGRENGALFRFVASLEHLTGVMLDEWFATELNDDEIRRTREGARVVPPPPQEYLVFDLRFMRQGGLEQEPTLIVHRWVEGTETEPGSWEQCEHLSCAPNPEGIRTTMEPLLKRFESTHVSIGIILPRERFDWHPEKWKFDPWREDPHESEGEFTLESKYPVVLHTDRIYARRPTTRELWAERLASIRESFDTQVPDIEWISPQSLHIDPGARKYSCIVLEPTSSTAPSSESRDALNAAIVAGMPFIFWSDDEPYDPVTARSRIEGFIQMGLRDVPERLMVERLELQATTGYSLRVIWDDDARLPSERTLL